MSEYWKSTPKYWCKHCSTYVKDTPFEKKQHENTGKHQGSLQRFLNGIQKDHDRGEREKDKAKAEVERLNRVVGNSVTTGTPRPAPASSTSRASSSSTLSAADQKRQWAQLAEMGVAMPDSARAQLAVAGEWQTITRTPEEPTPDPVDSKLSTGVHKRRRGSLEDTGEVTDRMRTHNWGTSKRIHPAEQTTRDDIDALLAASVKRVSESAMPEADVTPESKVEQDSPSTTDATLKVEQQSCEIKREPGSGQLPAGSDQNGAAESPAQQMPVFKKRKHKIVLPV